MLFVFGHLLGLLIGAAVLVVGACLDEVRP